MGTTTGTSGTTGSSSSEWQIVSSSGLPSGDLYAVWGRSANDVWIVGAGDGIAHWDGTTWSAVTAPAGGGLGNVWGTDNQVWFGGSDRILHRNASGQWDSTNTSAAIRGIWGSSATDIWAVGYSLGTGGEPVILHFDGVQWSPATLPVSGRSQLMAVWGDRADDVWAVGGASAGSPSALVLHWDGASWSTFDAHGSGQLNSVWGTPFEGAGDVFAVGLYAAPAYNSARIVHASGCTWAQETIASAQPLYGVWGAADGILDAWAVGAQGTLFHRDGSTWSEVTSPTSQDLLAIWGTSDATAAWIVGRGGTVLVHHQPAPQSGSGGWGPTCEPGTNGTTTGGSGSTGANNGSTGGTTGTSGTSGSTGTSGTTSTPGGTPPPVVSAFSVSPRSVVAGSAFTVSYTVSDSGGPGLARVELWRADDTAAGPTGWAEVNRTALGGNGPSSGTFSDDPLTSGSYWYGLHVVDTAGAMSTEGALGPIKVTVTP